VAFGVKMTAYSSGEALKVARIRARPLDEAGRARRRRAGRVRVAETAHSHACGVRGEPTVGRQAGASVVELGVPAGVETAVVRRAEFVHESVKSRLNVQTTTYDWEKA